MVNYVYFYAVKSNKLLIVEKTATSEDWPEQKNLSLFALHLLSQVFSECLRSREV